MPKLTGSGTSAASLLGCPAATGRLTQRAIGPVSLGLARTKAHKRFRWSTGGRRYWDYFCLAPVGIRAGYPSPALLRILPRKQRRGATGHAVFILSFNHRYALHGVHPGWKFTKKLSRRLHLGKGFKLGPATWYLVRNGSSTGLIEVHRGFVQGVGVADRRFTKTRRTTVRYLNAFR